MFDVNVRASNIGYTFLKEKLRSVLSRVGWRFAKQIRPDLDKANRGIMETGLPADLTGRASSPHITAR